ncbi:MAG: proteasome lid subunit RPN8/RPN11 [Hyphomicrobiaceae bacterium]|jgi:proteasome lid subunit RPN8/RPN11
MKLDREVLNAMSEHSLEEYPEECCGLLIGLPDGSVRVHRIRNIQNEMHATDPERYPRTAATAYAGHPGDLRIGLEAADERDHKLVAFYHSHPDHDAYFSEEDIAQATPFGEPNYPDAVQVVVSVYDRVVRVITGFAWSDASQTFVPEPVEEG